MTTQRLTIAILLVALVSTTTAQYAWVSEETFEDTHLAAYDYAYARIGNTVFLFGKASIQTLDLSTRILRTHDDAKLNFYKTAQQLYAPSSPAPTKLTGGLDKLLPKSEVAPFDRFAATAEAVDADNIIVLGGHRGSYVTRQSSVWKYTVSTKTWTRMAPMPVARSMHVSTVASSTIYVHSGAETEHVARTSRNGKRTWTQYLSRYATTTLRYDVNANAWSTLTAANADSAHPPVVHATSTAAPANHWCIYGGRRSAAAASSDARGLAKSLEPNVMSCLNLLSLSWNRYDGPQGETKGRVHAQMATIPSATHIWLHGGLTTGKVRKTILQFEWATKTWSPLTMCTLRKSKTMLNRRSSFATFLGSKLYIIGGHGEKTGDVWTLDTCSSAITTFVNIGGTRFATLDSAAFDTQRITCDTSAKYVLPTGWNLATDTPAARMAVRMGRWGTDCLKVGNAAVPTTRYLADRNCTIAASAIDTSAAVDLYSTATCDPGNSLRHLITQPGAAGDQNRADGSTRSITNYFVHNGLRYALLDNAAVDASKSGCQSKPLPLPTTGGWQLAADTTANRAALLGSKHKLATSCVVMANGNAYSTIDASACGTNLLTSEAGLHMPTDCNRRILITAPASGSDTDSWLWNATSLTHTREAKGFQWASLSDDKVGARGSGSCAHNAGRQLPAGWSVAPDDDATRSFLRFARFGSRGCFVLADGKSVHRSGKRNCAAANALLNLGSLYAARDCQHRVLLRRAAPVSTKNRGGQCRAFGDPHYTTFDGVRYNYYGLGDHVLMQTVPQAGSSQAKLRIEARHFRLNRASANQRVAVSINGTVLAIDAHHEPLPAITVNNVLTTIALDSASMGVLAVAPGISLTQRGASVPLMSSLGKRNRGKNLARMEFQLDLTAPYPPVTLNAYIRASGVAPFRVMDLKVTVRQQDGQADLVTEGLCGSLDFNSTNDLTSPNNVQYVRAQGQLYGATWAVPSNSSLFNAPIPEGTDADYVPASEPPFATGKERTMANTACGDIQDDDLRHACLFDVAVTKDPAMGAAVAEVEAQERLEEAGPDDIPVLNATLITNVLEFGNHTFATLDNADPTSVHLGCQDACVPIPSGWRLAPDTAVVRASLSQASWGTACLALENGRGYNRAGKRCGANLLQFSADDTPCISVRECDARVLLVADQCASEGKLLNPGFDTPTQVPNAINLCLPPHTRAMHWVPNGLGYELDATVSRTVAEVRTHPVYSAKVTALDPNQIYGAFQRVELNQTVPEAFGVCGWSKAVDVVTRTRLPSADYSVYIDVEYTDGTSVFSLYSEFAIGTHGWQQRCVDHIPDKPVKAVMVHANARYITGQVWFDDFTLGCASTHAANLLRNEDMDVGTGWIAFKDGFQPDNTEDQGDRDGMGSGGALKMSNSDDTSSKGAFQVVVMDPSKQVAPEGKSLALLIGGWSKAENVSGTEDANYAIYVDIRYASGEHVWSQVAPFSTGTHDWEHKQVSITLGGPITSFQVVCLFRNHTGTVWFDEPSAILTTVDSLSAPGISYGDPHFLSLDGQFYSMQGIGEFWLYRDTRLSVQTRHVQAGRASVNAALAVQLDGGDVLQLERATGTNLPLVKVNGVDMDYVHRSVSLDNGQGSLSVVGDLKGLGGSMSFTLVHFATGHEVTATLRVSGFGTQYLQIHVRVPLPFAGNGEGLLGNFNGDPTDDLIDADGNELDIQTATQDQIRTQFGMSWRVTDDDSLFARAPGASASSVADLEFVPAKLTDFSPSLVLDAQTKCVAGSTALQRACMFDILATGDDSFGSSGTTVAGEAGGVAMPLDTGSAFSDGGNDSSSTTDPAKTTAAPTEENWWTPLRLGGVIAGSIVFALLLIAAVAYLYIHRNERKKQTDDKGRVRLSSV